MATHSGAGPPWPRSSRMDYELSTFRTGKFLIGFKFTCSRLTWLLCGFKRSRSCYIQVLMGTFYGGIYYGYSLR